MIENIAREMAGISQLVELRNWNDECVYSFSNTPWKINVEPKVMEVWKMNFLVNWVIFSFHVNFQGCNHGSGKWMNMGYI